MYIYACSFMPHKIPGKRLRCVMYLNVHVRQQHTEITGKECENEATWSLHSEEQLQWISETRSRTTTEDNAGT